MMNVKISYSCFPPHPMSIHISMPLSTNGENQVFRTYKHTRARMPIFSLLSMHSCKGNANREKTKWANWLEPTRI